MKQWQVISIMVVIALVAGSGGYLLQRQSDSGEKVASKPPVISIEEVKGLPLPDLSLVDMEGTERQFSEWKGKVIAINFWATWCPPCRDEIPHFVELQTEYGVKGLQFIGIALHTAEEITDFVNEFNVNYPSLVGRDDVVKAARQLGNDIGALPYTVIVDRDGIIQFVRRGPLSMEEAERVITSLL